MEISRSRHGFSELGEPAGKATSIRNDLEPFVSHLTAAHRTANAKAANAADSVADWRRQRPVLLGTRAGPPFGR